MDLLQKIAEENDDVTALSILSSTKKMYNDYYFINIFGKRYPELINYRKEGESIKHLYLRMLGIIGLLREEFKYTYTSGNPETLLSNILESEKKKGNLEKIMKEAIENRSFRMVKQLSKGKWDVSLLLSLAYEKGDVDMVKYIVKNKPDSRGTALIQASNRGNLDMIKYLMENKNDIKDNNISFALEEASRLGFLDIVKYLVENRADISHDDSLSLAFAVEKRHPEIVKYLLQNGANPGSAMRHHLYYKEDKDYLLSIISSMQ